MRLLVGFVKQWLVPGTLPFLFLAVVVAAVLLDLGATVAARAWLTILAVAYYLLSLPAVARLLIDRLGRDYHSLSDDECAAVCPAVVIVVGNGSVHYTDGQYAVDYLTRRSVYTAFEAARICRLAQPGQVIVTGGLRSHPGARPESELIEALLLECGVNGNAIVIESESRTTAEQATNVAAFIAGNRLSGPVVVVTTPAHMPRVMHYFTAAGLKVVPSATPELTYDDGLTGWPRWLPSMSSLIGSSSAIYEYMAGVLSWLPKRQRQNSV